MAEDTPTGETATPVAPSNETSTTPAPATDNKSTTDVEAAKREADQARMRANQLENELKALRDKQAEADRKQLEEKEEFKSLYEREKQERERLAQEREDEQRRNQLASATDSVFRNYPADVVEVAKTAGLSLTDDSDAAKSSFVEKLDAIKAKIAPNEAAGVTATNPQATAQATPSPEGRLGRPKTLGVDDGTNSFRDGNGEKFSKYVADLPAIKQMKQQAGLNVE